MNSISIWIRRISVLIVIGLFLVVTCAGQSYPRDTSYTAQSAFQKYKRQFPTIQLAKPSEPGRVRVLKDIPYSWTGNRFLTLDIFSIAEAEPKRFPMIFMIHGGGWKSGHKNMLYPLASDLAQAGYRTCVVEYRLSPESKYPAALKDIAMAMQWVVAHADTLAVDTRQMVLLGCSSGAQLATLLGVSSLWEVPKVQAIVNLDGILAFHHPESQEGIAAAQWLGGTYEEVPDRWEEASPLHHADENDPPILFVHSQYPRFQAGRDDMMTKLQNEQIKVYEWPNSPHAFWLFDPWFAPTVAYIDVFLARVLADQVD
ncbi:alpha/beta hydrolase [Reichenbachiella carrageenanivorans]|uniref:Alpha/beta hydrolase n=1 Tax=Reichenbachiella carrageenanivorans TaxID=2979869 RepID=A0ABY6D591_9BACT|nr:alpha/beta hydrolase [Reichenbachiella carrageenanivorans]UXX81331.1 alpha/beta hydrolase [Reichenbachiella carrageenanivorans]